MTLSLERESHTSRISWFTEPVLPEEIRKEREVLVDDHVEEQTEDSYAVLDAARALAGEHPNSSVALARLAQCELSFGHRVSARAAAFRSLEHAREQDHGAIAASLRVLSELGESARAYEIVRDWDLQPSVIAGLLAVKEGDLDAAERSLAGTEDTISKAVLGWIRLKQHDFGQAIRLLRAAARSRNAPSSVYTNLGYAYAGVGRWDRAIRVTRRALDLDPDDRIAVTNLAGFLMAVSREEEALRELREFSDIHRDLSVIRLQVDVELMIGHDKAAAKKKLERIKQVQAWSDATENEVAELDADITMLRRELGEIDRSRAIEELAALVARTDYQSLWIGRLLSSLLNERDQASMLAELIERMPASAEQKLPMSTRLAQLQGRFDVAVELAREWVAYSPFDPVAPTDLIYLLCDYKGDYESAIAVGREGLKRAPTFLPLINNVAYALASSGRTSEAKRILTVTREYPATIATRGFIELFEGRRREGDDLYQLAATVASETDPDLEETIRTRWLIALVQTGHLDATEVDKHLAIRDRSITETLASVLWQRVAIDRSA